MRALTYVLVVFTTVFIAMISSQVHAAIEVVEFETQRQEQQYKEVIDELRCVVCQNQNLADSDAPLAKDLREITADMVRRNQSKEQIKAFMVQRYGEFVLYRPPLNAANSLLWFGPFILLFVILILAVRFIANRQQQDHQGNNEDPYITEARREEIRALLQNDQSSNSSNEANTDA